MRWFLGVVLAVIVLVGRAEAQGQGQQWAPIPGVNWQRGPCVGILGDIAGVRVPKGFLFADQAATKNFLEATGNPANGTELGVIQPIGANWFALFEYDDVGYVKDDDKDSLDPKAMLKSITQGTEESNKERIKRGWPTMKIIGWGQQPTYNTQTNNLEWSIVGESEGERIINYNTRLLGRSGVMSVTLVDSPATIAQSIVPYRSVMQQFSFKKGERYAEYKPGDRVAQYGLAALVVGGATAVAFKAGLFKWLWKGIVVFFAAIGGIFRKLFGGGKRTSSRY